MKIPIIRGAIDRRILVNYRVDPEILAQHVPPPFRPQLVNGFGMAGICLIRLRDIRPRFLPPQCGIRSENAAHRIAVEWDDTSGVRSGVFVRRRDTNSWMNSLAGGRLFPGVHHHARFDVHESSDDYDVSLHSDDGAVSVRVFGRRSTTFPASSVFHSLHDASAFFQTGSLGFSATIDDGRFQALELRCGNWLVTPLEICEVRSSFFDDPAAFPPGSVQFDCACSMRDVAHEWHAHPDLACCQTSGAEALGDRHAA